MSTVDLSAIWRRQQVPPAPDSKDLLAKSAMVKKKIWRERWMTNVILLLTLVYINVIVYTSGPAMITTIIGAGITSIALMLYLFAAGMPKRGRDTAIDQPVKDCLQEMLQLKARQQFIHGRLLGLYFILLPTGLALCMIEYTGYMQPVAAIMAYTLTAAWIAFAWWYIRPRTIRKQQQSLHDVILQLEKVQQQLDDK